MSLGTVLLADDDRSIRTVLNQALTRIGCRVRTTGSTSTLWRWVEDGEGDLIVTDVMMPDGDALDLLPAIVKKRPNLPVIVMSAQNTVMTAIRATEAGAYEYLPKPFDLKEVIAHVKKALEGLDAKEEVAPAPTRPKEESLPLIGRSPAMQEVYRIMARLMNTDLTVMITGESGTGKELVAKALHNFGRRKSMPFIAVNMAAIPRELIESELFGHERGAFTGANERSAGKFELAQGGTLFLDEIGELPLTIQPKLLRAIQEGIFTRVGSTREVKVDIRIIAATNRDLKQEVAEGRFREDLFYRLNVVPVSLPPLRERREDIPRLVRFFVDRTVKQYGLSFPGFTPPVLKKLIDYPWPGNVRELANVVERMILLSDDDGVGEEDLPSELSQTGQGSGAFQVPPDGFSWEAHEHDCLRQALELAAGNRARAARLLDLPYKAFLYRLEKHGLA